MIVAFARKLMPFRSSSFIFNDFFSISSRALCASSFTSNDVTCIFHNRKLDILSNFSTLNLVVVVVLLAITLIPIVVINYRYNKSETPSWQLGIRSESVEDVSLASNRDKSPHNKRTSDLTWFDKSAYVDREEGRNFIENREENTRLTSRFIICTNLIHVRA